MMLGAVSIAILIAAGTAAILKVALVAVEGITRIATKGPRS